MMLSSGAGRNPVVQRVEKAAVMAGHKMRREDANGRDAKISCAVYTAADLARTDPKRRRYAAGDVLDPGCHALQQLAGCAGQGAGRTFLALDVEDICLRQRLRLDYRGSQI